MKNLVIYLSIAIAVITAAIAAMVVNGDRKDEAKAREKTAANELKIRRSEADAAADLAKARADERIAEVANAQAESNALVRARLERETAEENRIAAEAESAAKEAALKLAKEESAKAEAVRDEARLTAEKTRNEATTASANAKAAEAKLEAARLEAEAAANSAEKLAARERELASREQEIVEWRDRLAAREAELIEWARELEPEKDIAALSSAGGPEDSVFDSEGRIVKLEKKPYDPEKDPKLPRASRTLARAERLMRESTDRTIAESRAEVVRRLEAIYVQALKEDRVVDADSIRANLESLYPDWKFTGEAKDGKANE